MIKKLLGAVGGVILLVVSLILVVKDINQGLQSVTVLTYYGFSPYFFYVIGLVFGAYKIVYLITNKQSLNEIFQGPEAFSAQARMSLFLIFLVAAIYIIIYNAVSGFQPLTLVETLGFVFLAIDYL
ncbi:hypothetical protein HS1genome_0082 [Sulfodiicoccus acidiphilus]|uniref:Uncharacterized protein n=1 Tax=Sulfodiicoccus acidiphilus TaxID=1670455 RepID=A0A348B0J1_9CREN|nr:hypothetical protein [Sulfodiicoccus acidiphilus]BBD71693.1 hypothetical protein HS1genome_0082 [Sulfodiicoccus acidiphilus]GGT86559.1 hypothetical protein GCM10007116_00640 [Sulfodiicoccus acidiphilus]